MGGTPLIHLGRSAPAGRERVLLQLESLEPSASVHDRTALALLEGVPSGGVAVVPGFGDEAIAAALAGKARGIRVLAVLPPRVSAETLQLLGYLGAEVARAPGMAAARELASRLARERGAHLADPFVSAASVRAIEEGLGAELEQACADVVVACAGTGALLAGISRALTARIVRVDAEPGSALPGISADLEPPLLARGRVDARMTVSDAEALATQSLLARSEGILVGPVTGAAVFAALAIADELGAGTVLAVATETGERSLSTSFAEAP